MRTNTIRLIVFDLDGTLINSEHDLANSVNATLASYNRPPLPHDLIATYIGDGAGMLVRRALAGSIGAPPDEELAAHALEFFLDYYREHKLDFTLPYDGVLDALQTLQAQLPGTKMAVLTNKPVRPSRQICDALGLSPFFFQNYGGDSFVTKKPDPEGLLTLMREATVSADECVLIGDSEVDVSTARNAGVRCIGCTFGLSPEKLLAAKPDLVAQSAAEWPALIASLIE